ncbi:MAG: prenyltransferase/squalene oxidase repeat-containing protein [Planctomycetia bacterium]
MQHDRSDTPWIERAITSPTVRAGYLSLVAHIVICIVLAILALEAHRPPTVKPLHLRFGALEPPGDEPLAEVAFGAALDSPEEIAAEAEPPAAASTAPPVDDIPLVAVDEPAADIVQATDTPERFDPTGPPAHAVSVRVDASPATGAAAAADRAATLSTGTAAFATRRGSSRAAAARARGGSAASEAAVEAGLAWLALHQAADGSWQFDLSGCRCDGACRDPGTLTGSTASTAIALLPFLGAGSTHVDGPYQQTVSRGLYYLVSRMQPTPRGGDFCEGTMYGHGVTTLALAEALGMTGDEMLVPYVRDAVRFTETAQDLHGGGWRYLPGQAGDVTVTAWQIAALKSAALAGVEVPSPTIEAASRFLDRVQAQGGAAYGYRTPAAKPCTSAIGLLCRMYTGWGSTQEPLQRGITNLAKPGPHPTNIYQNFYLAQALLQLDHPAWPHWNVKNRTQLVKQQARFGHEAGSWFFADRDTAPGGRLAHTALAVLTLEVYYRLLPIYQEEAVDGGF